LCPTEDRSAAVEMRALSFLRDQLLHVRTRTGAKEDWDTEDEPKRMPPDRQAVVGRGFLPLP
jgi:hypothetical protein